MLLQRTILMIEPTQEFIRSIVKKHFDVGDEEVGLVKIQFYFEDIDFKEKFGTNSRVRNLQSFVYA